MSEMVERVAEKICDDLSCDATCEARPGLCERIARAAIAATREPDEAMKAIDGVHWGYSCPICGGLTEGWYAMHDEALR